jgi:hypothetical protein
MTTYTLKLDYFSVFPIHMSYERISWENSTAKEIFTIRKKSVDLDERQV